MKHPITKHFLLRQIKILEKNFYYKEVQYLEDYKQSLIYLFSNNKITDQKKIDLKEKYKKDLELSLKDYDNHIYFFRNMLKEINYEEKYGK